MTDDETILSAIQPTYIKFVSEIVGITALSDESTSYIANEVTFRLKELIEQARKFCLHGRRRRLLADDIDRAMQSRNIEPLFGFVARDGIPFRMAGSHGRDLFVLDDKDVELAQVMNANPPKAPVDVSLRSHWLVIDGEQPAIPENPMPTRTDTLLPLPNKSAAALPRPGAMLPYTKQSRKATEQVMVKSSTVHPISMEQQIFFKEISEACVGADETRRQEALQSLLTDTGLQSLVPRFAITISEGVRCNIVQRNMAVLIYLMRITQSLVNNASVNLEHALHLIIPSVLSCILCRQLCARLEVDNHWALREFSSRLLAALCRSYRIGDVRERITKILTDAYRSVNSSNATLYGALYALMELGYSEEIKNIILSRLSALLDDTRPTQVHKSTADKVASDRLHTLLQNFERNTNRGVDRRCSGVTSL